MCPTTVTGPPCQGDAADITNPWGSADRGRVLRCDEVILSATLTLRIMGPYIGNSAQDGRNPAQDTSSLMDNSLGMWRKFGSSVQVRMPQMANRHR